MIRYALKCERDHEFEAWFASSDAYDTLARAGQVTCAICGSTRVGKAIMAPNVVTSRGREAAPALPAEAEAETEAKPIATVKAPDPAFLEALKQVRAFVEANAEHVGPRFAEEARKIHYEETPQRAIYGEATADEAKSLYDEGIEFHPLPRLADDFN
jgi:hypothetical protein